MIAPHRSARLRGCGVLLGGVALLPLAGAAPPDEALQQARRQFSNPQINAVTFRNTADFFPVGLVAGDTPAPLATRLRALCPLVRLGDEEVDFDTALRRTRTNALLVLHNGEIIAERYFNGATPDSRFIGWSMSKSVVSILTGIALARGELTSLDDPIERHLPEVAGTPFAGVTLLQLLQMRDGTDYREMPGGGPPHVEILRERAAVRNEQRFTDFRILGLQRQTEPGSTFNYSTLSTGLLGRVLEQATGQSLARFTEEVLWRPAGMEFPAAWLLDGELPEGRAIAGGGFNAALRDFGRLGLMMLNQGRANGHQVVPADWVERSTRSSADTVVIAEEMRGYALHWWTLAGTPIFEAIGIHGQFLSIDPATRTVIVKLSHWPGKGGLQPELDNLALLTAIRRDVTEVGGDQRCLRPPG